MAVRLEENTIVSAEICNRQKHRVRVVINFSDGAVLRADLRGDPHRDLAGRKLILRHPSPDPEARRREPLDLIQTGLAGDMTAARKVRVPTIPMEEVGEYYAADKEVPITWKNSVYLEWYSRTNGRVVLEASEFEMRMTEPAWEMREADEEAARKAVENALTSYLDALCVIDREKEADEAAMDDGKPMDEFAWEMFLRHSDDLSNRYAELVDKFGFENDDQIARYMKWDREVEAEDEGWGDGIDFPDHEELDDGEPPVRRRHPLQGQARQILDSVDLPRDDSDSPLVGLWSAVATVSAKLAGALSSYECDREPDAGFTIAQLKRCLRHIDTAVGEAKSTSPTHVQPLLEMRQSVIDLQNDLRKAM